MGGEGLAATEQNSLVKGQVLQMNFLTGRGQHTKQFVSENNRGGLSLT